MGLLAENWLYAAVAIAAAMVLAMSTGTAAFADESAVEVIAVTPGTSYSRSSPTGWTSTTGKEEIVEKIPRPKSSLTIRAYEGFGTLLPYIGDEQAYGVDVTAEIEKCPNGTERISALNIGGWLYEVDGDCSDYQRRSRVSVSAAGQANSAEENSPEEINAEEPGEPVLHCDSVTWRCRTIDRQSGHR